MSTSQNTYDESSPDSQVGRRGALKRAVGTGLIFYVAPQILGSVEVVHAQVISPGGTITQPVLGGGDSSGLAYLGLLPLAALPFIGGAGAAAAAGGAGGLAVPPTFFGIPLATTNSGALIARGDSPVPVPRRRAILGPRSSSRRPPGGPRRFGRSRRPIRGLG